MTWSGKPKTAPVDESTVERRRCSGCGAAIFEVPCRACALRRIRSPRPAARIPDEVNGQEVALTLEFRDPAAQVRYEEVRRLKIERGEAPVGGPELALWLALDAAT